MQKLPPETCGRKEQSGWHWLPLIAALVISVGWLVHAFSEPFAIQDDARQHVVWFEAMRNPALFRGDFIATFFVNSNTPIYKALYWLPAQLGLSPLLMAKLYPVALTLLTAWLAFRLFLTTGIGALAAALGAVLFVQGIWTSDDIASATARAFSWPMLLAVLVCWRENRPLSGAVLGALLSLIYPTAAVFAGGLISLMCLTALLDGRKTLSELRGLWAGPAIVVAGLFAGALTAVALGTGGGIVSAGDARQMAEFQDGGRTAFFVADPVKFWLLSKRSGALPEPVLRHVVLVLLVVLAALRWKSLPVAVRRFALAALVAGLVLWAAAHLVLFKLYLPGRFPLIGERLAFALLAGATVTAWLPQRQKVWKRLGVAVAILPLLVVLVPPRFLGFVTMPEAPGIMRVLAQQPPETLVAGFSPDLDNVPAAALRRVLTAREYHLPYDVQYVVSMRERLADTAAAVFAPGPEGVQALVQRYGVTHILVKRADVTPSEARKSWWWSVLAQNGQQPECIQSSCRTWILEQNRCVVAEERQQVLLSAACLLGEGTGGSGPHQGGAGSRSADGEFPSEAG